MVLATSACPQQRTAQIDGSGERFGRNALHINPNAVNSRQLAEGVDHGEHRAALLRFGKALRNAIEIRGEIDGGHAVFHGDAQQVAAV